MLHSLLRLPLAGSILLMAALLPPTTQAQTAPPSFFATYTYTAYTVYDTSSDEPTVVRGVGGTLTLHPTGTYAKRLSIAGNDGPMLFKQDGTFTLAGDSIRFAFRDQKGADVQRGTFRFDPATRQLTLTILGYPAGNQGVYELMAAAPAKPTINPTSKTSKKRRH